MICDNCKKHIERKFLSKSKTVNCLNYACERPYKNEGLIDCTRDEICDYIYAIIQPERSKREDINFYCKKCGFSGHQFRTSFDGKIKCPDCNEINDAVL